MKSVKRILLSRMRFIGDIVLTTPIIRSVREHYPDAFIAYLGEREAVTLLEQNPNLNEILSYDFSKSSFLESSRVILQIRKRKFDAVVDLFSNPRTALLMAASGAPIRIGKKSHGRGNLYTHTIEDDGQPKSAIDFHYQYVKPLGVNPGNHTTELFLTDEEKQKAQEFLYSIASPSSGPIIGINPGATWPAKIWIKERFIALAGLLGEHLKAHIVLLQGPKDGNLAEDIARESQSNVTVLPQMPLRRLAAILSKLNLFISNDNGTMHMAVAAGTPTIGIFGPGEENIWFPYGKPHIAVRKNVPCHPCHLDYCNRQGTEYMECMKLLSVEDVFQAVISCLQGLNPRSPVSFLR